jgi:8-oxo-dGTP diphosphatase
VAGFLFSPECKEVALILKARPDWQAGKLNGIGGHVEGAEHPDSAMIREFREETGLHITSWMPFCQFLSREWSCYFYAAISSNLHEVRSMTDEAVLIFKTDELPKNVISNIRWLVPMARDFLLGGDKSFDIATVAFPM